MMKKLLLSSSVVILYFLAFLDVKAQDDIAATFTPTPSFDYNVTANNPNPNDGVDTHPLSGPYTQGNIIMTSFGIGARQESNNGSALFRYLNFGSNFNATTKANSIDFVSTSDIKQITLLFRGGGGSAAAQPVVYAGADEASAVIINSGQVGYIDGFPAGAGLAPGKYSTGVFPAGTKYVRIIRTSGQTLRIYRVLASTAVFTLPLDFLSFSAKPSTFGSVDLDWKTTNEVNTKNFEVQSRTANSEFKTIGFVDSKNTAGVHNYSFTDSKPLASTVYYRIKQVDKDGEFDYSDVKSVNLKQGISLAVYPNPVSDVLSVKHPTSVNRVTIINLEGKKLLEKAVSNDTISTDINVASLHVGTYIVVVDANGEQSSAKFIKK
ncbi:T9SS type A sorting domain-containing protein [Pedobacter glucosidilyticus]|uniref:T9SS type A sorting domain-containing protein n=1 Tax=Pedobacter glucosidilyticus TaxID=1122941 RepID=UPI0026F2539E|nr:T9SS type A sorting domain-containing protein [Pedobacter glucosidilyticus]